MRSDLVQTVWIAHDSVVYDSLALPLLAPAVSRWMCVLVVVVALAVILALPMSLLTTIDLTIS